MRTFKLTLAYDGTGLVGWQRQAAGTSVQGLLEEALGQLDGRPVAALSAGRTDAGVHALGQVAGVVIERAIDPRSLVRALNARLPSEVRVRQAVEVPPTFHARFDAISKTYRYRIWNDEVLSPFEHGYVWHVPAPLDVKKMAAAAAVFEGRHDFVAFETVGSDAPTTDRLILSARVFAARAGFEGGISASLRTDIDIDPADDSDGERAVGGAEKGGPSGALVTLEITGDGFLRHMVRAMAGTLVEVGCGRRPVRWVAEVLSSRRRALAGPTAPPEGLFLVSVDYPPSFR